MVVRLSAASVFLLAAISAASAEPLDVQRAYSKPDEATGSPIMIVRLSEEGAKTLARITAAQAGRQISIRFKGHVLVEPIVHSPITGRDFQVTNVGDAAAAKALAADIEAAGTLDISAVK
jgi:preprotein translocase subunit SecD